MQKFVLMADRFTPLQESTILNNRTLSVHMMAIADANFARKYHPIFEKIEQYARRHGYKWHVIGTDSENCTKLHADFIFRKHCMVAE